MDRLFGAVVAANLLDEGIVTDAKAAAAAVADKARTAYDKAKGPVGGTFDKVKKYVVDSAHELRDVGRTQVPDMTVQDAAKAVQRGAEHVSVATQHGAGKVIKKTGNVAIKKGFILNKKGKELQNA
jgi:hypothetical protein